MGVAEPAARGFEATAGIYEARRPSYPDEAVDWLCRELGVTASSRVVDLAAGTGKFTRPLAERAPSTVAVEPLAAMAAQFASSLNRPICRGLAEALPLRTASVDAVFAAQAFHWFDFEGALAEIHRVLRDGGGVGLIWNMRDERHDWTARLGDIRRRYGDIRYDTGEWRRDFDASPLFGPLVERQFEYQQVLEPEGVVELMASRSFIAALPAEEHQAVRQEVRDLLASHPDTRGQLRVVVPYRTDAYWCRKAPGGTP